MGAAIPISCGEAGAGWDDSATQRVAGGAAKGGAKIVSCSQAVGQNWAFLETPFLRHGPGFQPGNGVDVPQAWQLFIIHENTTLHFPHKYCCLPPFVNAYFSQKINRQKSKVF